MMLDDIFEPQSDAEREIAAVEALSVSVQLAIQRAMMDHGVSQKELAERLGLTPARVSQMLSSHGSNLTIKTLGRISAALGDRFDFVKRQEAKTQEVKAVDAAPLKKLAEEAVKTALPSRKYHWQQSIANDNDTPAEYVKAA